MSVDLIEENWGDINIEDQGDDPDLDLPEEDTIEPYIFTLASDSISVADSMLPPRLAINVSPITESLS